MSGFGRWSIRGLGHGFVLIGVVAALPFVVSLSACACGPCGTMERTFAIDGPEAVQILDTHGQPTPAACAMICRQVVNGTLHAARPDGSSAVDAGAENSYLGPAESCEVGSTGTALALTCHFAIPCGV